MKTIFAATVILILSTFTIIPCYASEYTPVLADTLKITVSNLTPGLKTPFIINDTMHFRILKNRMGQIKSMVNELRTTNAISSPSVLGYSGLGLYSTNLEELCIFNVFDGRMSVVTSAVSSHLDYLNDFNFETEYLIAKVGYKENLSTLINSKTVLFSSLIPDELKRTQTRYGILTLELLSDTFNIDFSQLENRFEYFPPRDKQPIFKDIQITRAHEISSSQNAFRISSPEGITRLNGVNILLDSYSFYNKSIDSILKYNIPLLDSLSSNINTIQFEKYFIFSPDVHKYSFFIRTTDLGVVYLQPISYTIGGINRIYFFWVYSSDEIFDMAALKKFENQTSKLQTVSKKYFYNVLSSNRFVNLSGQVLPNLDIKRIKTVPGYFLLVGDKTKKLLLAVE